MADIFHNGKGLVNVLENHRNLCSCHDTIPTSLPSHTLLFIFFFKDTFTSMGFENTEGISLQ